jgi:hypothetical protein
MNPQALTAVCSVPTGMLGRVRCGAALQCVLLAFAAAACAQELNSANRTTGPADAVQVPCSSTDTVPDSAPLRVGAPLRSPQESNVTQALVAARAAQAEGPAPATPAPTEVPGPLYPPAEDDGPADDSITFAIPSTVQRTTRLVPVPAYAEAGCDVDAAAECPASLSACLSEAPTSRDAACTCFWRNGQCYRRLGCTELLPRADVRYCEHRLLCPMDMCEGSGAVAEALPLLAVALAAATAVAAAGAG